MALDAALIGLGSSVVKTACAVWLGESRLAVGASQSLVDLLAKRVTGVMEQRRLVRQFDQLVDVVAEKLLAVLRHEFSGVPEFEREAAAEAVRDTLGAGVLTDDVLLDADLDPVSLDRVLRRSTSDVVHRVGLSEGGEALYNLLLRESCTYVVEVATTLPRFEATALVELLRRESAILASVRDVLARLPERRALGDTGFEADYRRLVVNRLDRLELFGVTLSESSRRYPLTIAYVSLAASEGSGQHTTPTAPRGVNRYGLAGMIERVGPLIGDAGVELVLAGSRRVLVRGAAGSGKTTLLQWLAVSTARRRFDAELASWNDLVPFFIPLRRYTDTDFPSPQGFLDQVGRHIAQEMPTGWVHSLLRDGRAVVLADGLDERTDMYRDLLSDRQVLVVL
ncbi:NACHT domain-containing protein, partial [Kibdelosporangium lantanae]